MKKRRTKEVRISPKVSAAIAALRAFVSGNFQDLADELAANGCSIKDFQEAALVVDEQMMWERKISEILVRLKVPLPNNFTCEDLLEIAAAAGDRDAQAMIAADALKALLLE
jgi:hypothetical protein